MKTATSKRDPGSNRAKADNARIPSEEVAGALAPQNSRRMLSSSQTDDGEQIIELFEDDFPEAEDVHCFLARCLAFPAYYGKNLAALSDCLGDICTRVTIIAIRDEKGQRRNWFGRICTVIERSAAENPFLVFVREETLQPFDI